MANGNERCLVVLRSSNRNGGGDCSALASRVVVAAAARQPAMLDYTRGRVLGGGEDNDTVMEVR